MTSHRLLAMPGLVLVLLCATGCATNPAPVPSVAVGTRDHITLRIAPDDLGCDAVGYRQVMFRIDPAAAEQVWAVANTGEALRTYWSPQFTGGTADDPVVRAPGGDVLVTDGDVLAIPVRGWPELHGYFVCPSHNALYVLLRRPP